MSVLFVPLFAAAVLSADGASVYRENCAACHGKEGHGDGETAKELKYKPRDFREGKFAFGNTAGAMVKTVMSGIPGEETARMPAFKSVLAAEEIDAVVQYVRTMMPVEPAPTPTDMKLEPRDGPLIVRGILPGLKEGEPPLARGLLLGLPSGFSFEYETDSVRLLAVRRGEFVSRTDWEERGGRPLTPLGSVVFTTARSRWTEFAMAETEPGNSKVSPLVAKLRTTSTKGGSAEIGYDLVDSDGKLRAQVKERPRDVVASDGAGIVQEFEITAPAPVSLMNFLAFAHDPKFPMPDADDDVTKWKTGDWSLVHTSPASTIAVSFRLPGEGTFTQFPSKGVEVVTAMFTAGPTPVTLQRIAVARAATTPEQLQKMAAELKELR